MLEILKVRGSQETKPSTVDIISSASTVYVRENIVRIDEDGDQGFHGWEYDEKQYGVDEYANMVLRDELSGLKLALAESEEARLVDSNAIKLALAELAEGVV